MGVVHLARSPSGERVALKVIRPNVVGDDESRARLAREVNSLLRIRSSRVAEIIDADPWGDVPFVATRYVPGYSLHDQVAHEGPLEGDDLVWFARCLAQAIGAVHDVGVVHRDIKPSNILMEGRTPVLIDFGLARVADDPRLTAQGWLLGTPGYLAPEILHGEDASPASDIHSWAATVAYAGTGRAPFGSGPSVAVMDRVRRGEHDLTGLPEEVAEVVRAGLDPEPRNRPTIAAILTWLDLEDSSQGEDELDDEPTRVVALEPFPVTRPYTQYAPGLALPPPGDLPTLAVPVVPPPPAAYDEVDFTDDPWAAPEQAPPAKVGLGTRMRRATLLLCLGAGVSLAFAAAPWVALAVVAVLVWLVRTVSRTASAAAERRQLRGSRWYDGVQTVLGVPVHVFSSVPGTLALLLWASGLGAAVGLILFTGLAPTSTILAGVGAGFAVGVWWGPGSTRVRRVVAPVVRPFAARPVVWVVVLLAAVVSLASASTQLPADPAWDPTGGRWSDARPW